MPNTEKPTHNNMGSPNKAVSAKRERPRHTKMFPNPTRTKQASKDECDINLILKTAAKNGGVITHLKEKRLMGDFTQHPEYHEAMNFIAEANSAFAELPAHVRGEFENDPAKFLAFAEDPENIEHMRELGLAPEAPPEPPEPEPTNVRIVDAADVVKAPPEPSEPSA